MASVIRVKNYEEALTTANDSERVVGERRHRQPQVLDPFQAPQPIGNGDGERLPTAGVYNHVPFGCRKGSSYGPGEQGRYA